MATKTQTLDQYRDIMEKADQLAEKAAEEVRTRAKELLDELAVLGEEYEELTGKNLPELSKLNGSSPRKTKKSTASSPNRKRTKLKGGYANLTVPEAITKALKGVKNGLGPAEVANKIGGNKNTVTVAMSNMAKDGTLKRPERGTYTL